MVVTNFRRKAERPFVSFVHCVAENAPVSFLSRDTKWGLFQTFNIETFFFHAAKSCSLCFHVFHIHVRLAGLIGRAVLVCLFVMPIMTNVFVWQYQRIASGPELFTYSGCQQLLSHSRKKNHPSGDSLICVSIATTQWAGGVWYSRVYWRWLDWRRRAINVRCMGHAYTCSSCVYFLSSH